MDDITKRQIEKEIEEFITNLFEKHQDLRVIYFDKDMRPIFTDNDGISKHKTFSIFRRHITEDEKYKIKYHING